MMMMMMTTFITGKLSILTF